MPQSPDLYYTPPSDEIFEEVRQRALDMWSQYDHMDYVKSKQDRIKDIPNVQDNLMYMVAMFDIHNQQRLATTLSKEARQAIHERLVSSGTPGWSNPFQQ